MTVWVQICVMVDKDVVGGGRDRSFSDSLTH